MREQLIRYLLGELDAEEHRELQLHLKNDPELRAELAQLRSCLAGSDDADLYAPDAPTGLASRTADCVANSDEFGSSPVMRSSSQLSQTEDTPHGFLGWSMADLTVAGGVMLAVSMLIFPALIKSRDGTRQTQCSDHLRQITQYVAIDTENNGGIYPLVGEHETAGVFAIRLIERGHVEPAELRVLLVCPGAPLANRYRRGELSIPLPTADQIRGMSPGQLVRVTALASPFYNYRFPYLDKRGYHGIRNVHQTLSPILADASGDENVDPMSPNHGGRLVQIVSADGGVRRLATFTLPGLDDDMYHNDRGKMAAGLSPFDIVLGRTDATPSGELPANR